MMRQIWEICIVKGNWYPVMTWMFNKKETLASWGFQSRGRDKDINKCLLNGYGGGAFMRVNFKFLKLFLKS